MTISGALLALGARGKHELTRDARHHPTPPIEFFKGSMRAMRNSTRQHFTELQLEILRCVNAGPVCAASGLAARSALSMGCCRRSGGVAGASTSCSRARSRSDRRHRNSPMTSRVPSAACTSRQACQGSRQRRSCPTSSACTCIWAGCGIGVSSPAGCTAGAGLPLWRPEASAPLFNHLRRPLVDPFACRRQPADELLAATRENLDLGTTA